MDATITVYW